jgi:hypothetical protein
MDRERERDISAGYNARMSDGAIFSLSSSEQAGLVIQQDHGDLAAPSGQCTNYLTVIARTE